MRYLKRGIEVLGNSFKIAKDLHKRFGFSLCGLYYDILRARLLYGASEEDYMAMEFYRKSHKEQSGYNTFRRNFVEFFNAFYEKSSVELFDDKSKFINVFANYIIHDVLFTGEKSAEEIEQFIAKHETIVVKPILGCEGVGVYKLNMNDIAKKEELFALINNGSHFVLEECIVQHPKTAELNPSSVNTVRVETIIDAEGEVHITNSVCIMGTTSSIVNNTHSGGIMCHIEPDTGIFDSFGRNPKGELYFRHPATNIVLPGYQLPNWEGVLEYAKSLAKVVPSARKIGWDIVILENGYDIIEGNVRPGHCTQACDGRPRYKLEKSLI